MYVMSYFSPSYCIFFSIHSRQHKKEKATLATHIKLRFIICCIYVHMVFIRLGGNAKASYFNVDGVNAPIYFYFYVVVFTATCCTCLVFAKAITIVAEK